MLSTSSLRASLRVASAVHPRLLQSRLLTASSRSPEAKTSTDGQAVTLAPRNVPANERSSSDQVCPLFGPCRLKVHSSLSPTRRTGRLVRRQPICTETASQAPFSDRSGVRLSAQTRRAVRWRRVGRARNVGGWETGGTGSEWCAFDGFTKASFALRFRPFTIARFRTDRTSPSPQSNETCSVSSEAPLSAQRRLDRFDRGQLPRPVRLTAHASANNIHVYRFCSSFP